MMTPNLENYRSSQEYREILRILQKASTLQENFVWQTGAEGRNIVPIHHFEIDFVGREVVVFFDHLNHRVDQSRPLYVKLDYRSSVFKITEFRQSQSTITFAFPQEIKSQELRGDPRFLFQANSEKRVALKPSLQSDGGNEIHIRAIDVSLQGLGLLISEQNKAFMKNNRILWVTRLDDLKLDQPILAEVVYISPDVDAKFQSRKQKFFKVGLKLSGHLPHETFREFVQ